MKKLLILFMLVGCGNRPAQEASPTELYVLKRNAKDFSDSMKFKEASIDCGSGIHSGNMGYCTIFTEDVSLDISCRVNYIPKDSNERVCSFR